MWRLFASQGGGALTSGDASSILNPLVLGPLAAFVFVIFVSEIVVSGKAYRREISENVRLRELTEKVLPLSEKMVETSNRMLTTTDEMIKVAQEMVALIQRTMPVVRSGGQQAGR